MISPGKEGGERSIAAKSSSSEPIAAFSGDIILARFAAGVAGELLPGMVLVVARVEIVAVSFSATFKELWVTMVTALLIADRTEFAEY